MSLSFSPAGSQHPAWFELYQSAMIELDDSKLFLRIDEARNAILDRAEKIVNASPTDERRALNDALYVLSILEKVEGRRLLVPKVHSKKSSMPSEST